MKASPRILVLLTGLALVAVWWQSRAPEPTILAFRLGQTFEQAIAHDDGKQRHADAIQGHRRQARIGREPGGRHLGHRLADAGFGDREPPYLFPIDIDLGDDIYGWKPGDPMRWRQPENAVMGSVQ